ncbi:MAG: metallophosphoesterase [Phycisphaerae bacterium]
MRIIATSDLHYNVVRSRAPTEAIAREICRRGGDLLLLVGDSASTDLAVIERLFGLFDSFSGERLAVAGNHELWTPGGQDSLHRYENELSAICARCGVHYLDAAPYRADGVAIVGSVGWYDYTFRPAALSIPLRFYQHKVAPGAAARIESLKHLLDPEDDVPRGTLDITTRWMDGERVHLPMSDIDFAQHTAARLRSHLEQVEADADRIVAAVHHLPFAELVPHSILPNWEFATAFLGSELLGEALLDHLKVSHVFCGHSHRRRTCRKNHLVCTSIGSTYGKKQYETLDL